jgi:hypothetical protein
MRAAGRVRTYEEYVPSWWKGEAEAYSSTRAATRALGRPSMTPTS